MKRKRSSVLCCYNINIITLAFYFQYATLPKKKKNKKKRNVLHSGYIQSSPQVSEHILSPLLDTDLARTPGLNDPGLDFGFRPHLRTWVASCGSVFGHGLRVRERGGERETDRQTDTPPPPPPKYIEMYFST